MAALYQLFRAGQAPTITAGQDTARNVQLYQKAKQLEIDRLTLSQKEAAAKATAKQKAIKTQMEQNEKFVKGILQLTDDYNPADLQGYYQEQGIIARNWDQQEITQLSTEISAMQTGFKPYDQERFTKLDSRRRELNNRHIEMANTIGAISNAAQDFYTGLADGTYDPKLNNEGIKKGLDVFLKKGIKVTREPGVYNVLQPDGTWELVDSGKIQAQPLFFTPAPMMDLDKFENNLLAQVGDYSLTWVDDNGVRRTVSESKADRAGFEAQVRSFIESKVDVEGSNMVKKAKLDYPQNVSDREDYVDYLVDRLSLKAGYTRSAVPTKEEEDKLTVEDWFEANSPFSQITNKQANMGDDPESTDVMQNELRDYYPAPASMENKNYDINPNEIIITGVGSPYTTIEFPDPEDEDEARVEKLNTGVITQVKDQIKGATYKGVGKARIYTGTDPVTITYNIKGKTKAKVLKTGEQVPDWAYDGSVQVVSITRPEETKIPTSRFYQFFGGSPDEVKEVPSDILDARTYFAENSNELDVMNWTWQAKQLDFLVPINKRNNSVTGTVNEESRKEKLFKENGYINEWQNKFSAGTQTTRLQEEEFDPQKVL